MSWRLVQWNSATWWGGAEMRFLELCEELQRRKHFIRIIVRQPSHLWSKLLERDFVLDGDAPRQSGNLLRALRVGLRSRNWKVQIIHAHAGRDYVPALIAGKIANCPVVLHRHFLRPLNPLTRLLAQKWAGAVIAVSQQVAKILMNEDHLPPEKVTVIPMGIDVSRIHSAKRYTDAIDKIKKELKIGNRFFILSVGQLYPTKGHDILIQSIYHLRKMGIKAFLAIAGEGTEYTRLQSLIDQLGLCEHVRLLGYRDDVPILLHACDCFALLSWSDSCPGAIIEAMAAGKPIIACADGGVPEIVRDYAAAKLVPPLNSEAAAQAIASILSELPRLLSTSLQSAFTITATVDALENLYRRLLERG